MRWRLGDRIGIGRVVLLALNEGFHVRWREQPDIVAEGANLASTIVRDDAGFHRDQAARLGRQEREKPRPRQLALNGNRTIRTRTVNLKHGLRQVEPDDADLFHGRLPRGWFLNTATLHAALAADDGAEVRTALRSLVEAIVLVPVDGRLAIEVRGDLGGILALGQTQKARRDGRVDQLLIEQVKLVAGAGFEPATFRL
jgi:hypothetical protein